MTHTVTRTHPKVIEVRFNNLRNLSKWEQYVLLTSDIHYDHPACDHDMLFRHLDYAKSLNAVWIDHGDLMDCMQSKHDKRRCYDELHPRLMGANYLERVVDMVEEGITPYKHMLIAMSPGNHETAVRNHNSTDLTSILANRLGVATQPYYGFTQFRFTMGKGWCRSAVMYHHHGRGGGGRSRGILASDIMQGAADADIYHLGHNHSNYIHHGSRERVTQYGAVAESTVWFVRTPGYKREHETGSGWAIEKGHDPKSRGAALLRFYCEFVKDEKRPHGGGGDYRLCYDVRLLT